MAKELVMVNGDYYFVDDKTGKIFKLILQEETNDPDIIKEALLQVIRLKESQIRNGS